MRTRKVVKVKDLRVHMELRVCAVPGCDKHFWASLESKQSICTIRCLEFESRKIWRKGEKQPKIRRPGERRRNKRKKKAPQIDAFRKASLDSWALRIAKIRSGINKSGKSAFALLPGVAGLSLQQTN